MTTHRFQPTRYYTAIGSYEPVLHVADGDTVITSTVDPQGRDSRKEQVTIPGNPQTGPFYIDGAEPTDTLSVRFDRLWPNRDTGYSASVVASNVVEPDYVRELPKEKLIDWHIDRDHAIATLIKPIPELTDVALSLEPMLGCFGVAPSRGQSISTATSGQHGGNMDYRGFTSGTTAYLPVFVPGALFFLGDGHAVQGAGEILGTGIEVSLDVQFTVRLIKGKTISWPRGENTSYLFTVGNARPLDQALQHATTEMIRWLREDYGLGISDASILLGHCVEYDVANVYDPAYTIVCKIPKSKLPSSLE
jgi:acetamidase/formamidase